MIEIRNFTKVYDNFTAVNDLNLRIPEGEIFGLIGPNGAGKSTTLRYLATLLKPSSGSATINGFLVNSQVQEVRRNMGYLPDVFGVYDGMKLWEYLDFFAACYNIPRPRRMALIDDILYLLDLHNRRDHYVNGLSRGMRQRLGLAKTLIHDPPVLLLDEPASGLDPHARTEMVELLLELKSMGKTILISSHILPELARCCTSIGIMERGRLLAAGPLDDVRRNIQPHDTWEIVQLPEGADAEPLLQRTPGITEIQRINGRLLFSHQGGPERMAELVRLLVDGGVQVVSVRKREVTLEEVFLSVTRGEVA